MRTSLTSSLAALLVATATTATLATLATLGLGCSSADPMPLARQSTKAPTSTSTPGSGSGGAVDDLPPATPAQAAPAGGTEIGTETWQDGKQIPASVTIKAGATVEIEPGANVTVSSGVAITVSGTLSVKTGATHATISGPSWTGIVVASGGKLIVDGLDVTDAQNGVWTMTGGDASLTNAVITNAAMPFNMEAGSTLAVVKTKVVKATGPSTIAGTFTASYMDYDKGSAEGLELSDPAGTMTISDSTLHGIGGGDYVISRTGKLVKVEYTTITGAHCGFHFDAVDQFLVDHVSDDQNSYGAMLYGSGAGPNQIVSSNVRSTEKDLDMSGVNGVTTIDKSYTGGKNTLQTNTTVTNAATTPIADAKPR